MTGHYQQLTYEQRCQISALRRSGSTQRAMAELIGISQATLCRELVKKSGKALNEGVEERIIDGVTVRPTNMPKTIANCFKYCNKIGLDVALEALHEAWNSKSVQMDELWRYASICRVSNVIRPYLESLT